jgi:hypothetical protein
MKHAWYSWESVQAFSWETGENGCYRNRCEGVKWVHSYMEVECVKYTRIWDFRFSWWWIWRFYFSETAWCYIPEGCSLHRMIYFWGSCTEIETFATFHFLKVTLPFYKEVVCKEISDIYCIFMNKLQTHHLRNKNKKVQVNLLNH